MDNSEQSLDLFHLWFELCFLSWDLKNWKVGCRIVWTLVALLIKSKNWTFYHESIQHLIALAISKPFQDDDLVLIFCPWAACILLCKIKQFERPIFRCISSTISELAFSKSTAESFGLHYFQRILERSRSSFQTKLLTESASCRRTNLFQPDDNQQLWPRIPQGVFVETNYSFNWNETLTL